MTTRDLGWDVGPGPDPQPTQEAEAEAAALPPPPTRPRAGATRARVAAHLPDRNPLSAAFLAEAPATVADVIGYTRSGGFMPGEQPRWLELAGMAYGWLIAVPGTAALYAAAWVLQRPSRVVVAGFVAATAYLT